MSTFGSLNIARSGLFASQKGLDIIAKNIANANTVGYTRQRLQTAPVANNLGVEIVGIEQIRDSFLDSQFRSEFSLMSEWEIKSGALTTIEDFFQEPSDYGLNTTLGKFFNSLQEMSKKPAAKEIRSQVLQNALNLTDTLHYLYNKMTELQKNQNQQITTTVDQVNNLATTLQQLNEQILRSEAGGQNENDLRDQRNNVIDELSQLVNIKTTEHNDGTISVSIGSNYLVDKTNINLLEATADQINPISGESDLYSIKWKDDGTAVEVSGGWLRGYLDIRDGAGVSVLDNPKFLGIPYFVEKINLLSKTLVKSVNEIHMAGYTYPNESNGNVSQTGIPFFEPTDVENEVTAKNISISQAIMNNVFNIATADEAVVDTNSGNIAVIMQLAALRDINSLTLTVGGQGYNIGSLEGYTKEIASEISVVSANASNRLESQQVIAQSVENKRASVSGVSIDEEMTNLIQYQNAYAAAARVISAIDKNLETLINMAR